MMDHEQRAMIARMLNDNEVFNESMDNLERQYLEKALQLKEKDDLERFRLLEAIRTVRTVRRHIERTVVEGEALSKRDMKPLA